MPSPRRSIVAAALAAGLAVAALAGCGSATPGSDTTTAPGALTSGSKAPTAADVAVAGAITVTAGTDRSKAPTVTLATKPVSVSTTTVRVLSEGTGEAAKDGDIVTINQVLVLGSDGKVLDSSYESGIPAAFTVGDPQSIPGLSSGLRGAKKDAKLLVIIPPVDAFGTEGRPDVGVGPTDNLVFAADVTSVVTPLKQADGTEVAPRAGLPTVAFDPATGPTVTVSRTAAPKETVSQLLIEGKGATVTKGQALLVHYHGVLYKDGTVFDSSWSKGQPAQFPIGVGQVIKGWDNTLVGQKVGSRVLLVIPPKDGYGAEGSPPTISGTDTLVFVVDILAAT